MMSCGWLRAYKYREVPEGCGFYTLMMAVATLSHLPNWYWGVGSLVLERWVFRRPAIMMAT